MLFVCCLQSFHILLSKCWLIDLILDIVNWLAWCMDLRFDRSRLSTCVSVCLHDGWFCLCMSLGLVGSLLDLGVVGNLSHSQAVVGYMESVGVGVSCVE